MVHIPGRKLIARETLIHLALEPVQQLVDLQHGVIPAVAGVGCGHLLVADQQKGAVLVKGQTGVDHVGQLLPGELGQRGAADLRPVQQALIGGIAQGEKLVPELDGQFQVLRSVLDRIPGYGGVKAVRILIQRRGLVQRRHLQLLDLGALPQAALADLLMVAEHGGEVAELGVVAVTTGFHHGFQISFRFLRISPLYMQKQRSCKGTLSMP